MIWDVMTGNPLARSGTVVEADTLNEAKRIAQLMKLGGASGVVLQARDAAHLGDERRVGALTVRELGELMGLSDMQAARDNAAQEKAATAEVLATTQTILQHVRGIMSVQAVVTVDTAEDADRLAAELRSGVANHPGVRAVLVLAWVRDETYAKTAAATRPS